MRLLPRLLGARENCDMPHPIGLQASGRDITSMQRHTLSYYSKSAIQRREWVLISEYEILRAVEKGFQSTVICAVLCCECTSILVCLLLLPLATFQPETMPMARLHGCRWTCPQPHLLAVSTWCGDRASENRWMDTEKVLVLWEWRSRCCWCWWWWWCCCAG